MKKFLALLLVLAMALSLMACGSSGAAATEEPAEEAEEAVEEAEPAEEAEEAAPAAGDCTRIIVLNTAVLDLPVSDQPRGDEMRPAYAMADLIESVNCEGSDPCKTIGSDGYTATGSDRHADSGAYGYPGAHACAHGHALAVP